MKIIKWFTRYHCADGLVYVSNLVSNSREEAEGRFKAMAGENTVYSPVSANFIPVAIEIPDAALTEGGGQ